MAPQHCNTATLSNGADDIMDQRDLLKNFKSSKDFFVGVDSDGCVFPTMDLKHKKCFAPNFIKSYALQKVAGCAQETWEFVNLYSLDRGMNRFSALVKTVELLIRRPEFKKSGLKAPEISEIKKFVSSGKPQSNSGLKEYFANHDHPSLRTLLAWSEAVNRDIDTMVHDVKPFNLVRESLEKLASKADILVVSGTPVTALEKEWKEHGIDHYARLICGQEMGSKKDHLGLAAKGKYPDDRILMIGDAPGDHKAATANEALFFPIAPGREEKSWTLFFNEAMDRFLDGSYRGSREEGLIREFYGLLPERPGWE
jgi:phosphoglycolate phosphatase-like HAD superfamily hydrolase